MNINMNMNVKPVSFKGTYCIPLDTLKERNCRKLMVKSERDEFDMIFETGSYDNKSSLFLHTPFEQDSQISKLLKKLKIPFTEISPADTLTTDSIKSRIEMSDYDKMSGNILTEVSVEKLDKELKKQRDMYVGYKGANGSGYRYDRFKRYLSTGQPINATSISLRREHDGTISTIVKDGRHRFAVLRDMGFQKLPISISKDSIELAKEINLI